MKEVIHGKHLEMCLLARKDSSGLSGGVSPLPVPPQNRWKVLLRFFFSYRFLSA